MSTRRACASDICGGAVEGLLLRADADGHPLDDFAWCVALADPDSGRILHRLTIPARRTATAHQTVIDNVIAAVGWSAWQQPASPADATGSADKQPTADLLSDPPGVHILHTGLDEQPGDPQHGRTGRSPRPHHRRGHWRRQPHGPGRDRHKYIYTRLTIVNAHQGDLSWQIYQLPPG